MRLVTDNRASRILFDFLKSNDFQKPFIVPANVCEVIPNVFSEAGIKIEYSDINRDSLCVDVYPFINHLDDYSGLLYVHTYGVEETPFDIFKTIKDNNSDFTIIDDKCLCSPELTSPEPIADLTLFSVGEKKQVDLGSGGFGYVSDYYNLEKQLLPSGSFLTDEEWRMDITAIQQQIITAKEHKSRLNQIYQDMLPAAIQLDMCFQNWRYNILTDKKELILKSIFDGGLFASGHYVSQAKGIKQCKVAEMLHSKVINLFNDLYFAESQAIKLCEIINHTL